MDTTTTSKLLVARPQDDTPPQYVDIRRVGPDGKAGLVEVRCLQDEVTKVGQWMATHRNMLLQAWIDNKMIQTFVPNKH